MSDSSRAGATRGIDWSLYLVTDPYLGGGREEVVGVVQRALTGGVGVVQLRDKEGSDAQVEETARELLAILGDVPLFIDDRVEVAAKLGCHLHIGQNDMPLAQARAALGPEQLIGLSVGSDADLDALDGLATTSPHLLPDVVGIGPVFNTATKLDAPSGLGVKEARRLATRASERDIPAVAIGGINADSVSFLAGSDFSGVCVISAIMAAQDPEAAAHTLKEKFHG
nr:thiamine phosphate synthase [Corynebacterium sp. UBA5992]